MNTKFIRCFHCLRGICAKNVKKNLDEKRGGDFWWVLFMAVVDIGNMSVLSVVRQKMQLMIMP